MPRNLRFLPELWRKIEICAHMVLQVVPKRLYGITILRCAKAMKSRNLICVAAEASNHTA